MSKDDIIAVLVGIIQELIDDELCSLDHNGNCQAHDLSDNCVNKRAKEFLKKLGYE